MSQYELYTKALESFTRPVLFVDQQSLDKNVEWVRAQAGNKKIRIATKSLRCRSLIQKILSQDSLFQGLMTFTLDESLWLRSQGFQDILMGYPTTDVGALKELAKDPSGITLMVDRIEHLDLLDSIAGQNKSMFRICVDIDLSLDLPGVRFGVYRSQIHQERQLKKFLQHLKNCHHLKLVGLMGYEAQIAGVMDEDAPLIKVLKGLSLTQLKKRRASMVQIVRDSGHELEFVNGGGTGSLIHTRTEDVVTEVTIGSAFYAPVLFDHYQEFTLSPALFFALPIVRQPGPDIFTLLGGGYIASGEITPLKQPKVHLPEGLSFLKHEGFGEVQTPLKYSGSKPPKIGDKVILRHAKAGEVCERFNEVQLYSEGKLLDTLPTYRGEGKAFL